MRRGERKETEGKKGRERKKGRVREKKKRIREDGSGS